MAQFYSCKWSKSIVNQIYKRMLTELLKERTHQSHVAVEKLLIPKIKSLESQEGYVHLLDVFYGFFQPLEQMVEQYITHEHLPDLPERRKAASIQQDKLILDAPADAPLCNDLPAIQSTAQAIGAMYVMEGSTLGGVHISKMIETKVEEADGALQFFSGYGDATMVKWQRFQSFVNTYSNNTADHEAVIEAAEETFIKLKMWIQINYN